MGALKNIEIPRYNYDDYKSWEGKWELIYGYAYAMAPAPMIKHQKISNKIAWQLENILDECNECQALLPIDWKISDDTIVQPDNSVICHDPKLETYITKAPVIIFEVLSKSTASKDRLTKFNLYQDEGVKYYIIVDPNDKVAKVFHLKDGKYRKICDATDETVEFHIKKCKKRLKFNFKKIW